MSPHAFETANEDITETLTDAAPDAEAAGSSEELPTPRSPAEAQAQRESYLKKGEELIHSLL